MTLPFYLAGVGIVLLFGYYVFHVAVRGDYRAYGRLRPWASFLEILIFFVHGAFSSFFIPMAFPPLTTLNAGLGLAVFVIGLALTLYAMNGLGWQRSIGQEVNAVRTRGLYRFTRNPQIVAYTLVVAGYALLWPSWYALGWVAVYLVIAHWMVTTEEEHLSRVHGQDYAVYCASTPRYLFF